MRFQNVEEKPSLKKNYCYVKVCEYLIGHNVWQALSAFNHLGKWVLAYSYCQYRFI